MNWFVISIATAFFWGSSAVLAKIGTIRLSPRRILFTVGVTSFIFYLSIWIIFGSPFLPGNYLFPLLSEGCAAVSFIFYYKALEEAPVSLIAPITSSGIVISILIGVFVFHNPITKIQVAAIFSITAGIILLSIKDIQFKNGIWEGKWIIPALITMIGWGIWGGFSEISVRIVKPFNLNLFFAALALLIWTPYYLITGLKKKQKDNRIINPRLVKPRDFLFAISSAVVSDTGSVLFYLAVDISYVSLVIPVASLHPLVSVVYDIYNRNFPKPHQWIGIILILAGLFFIQGK